ncbi:RNB domain-containing protein [Colletotrichum orchidophilum]|uniref:RNB domain-containing protein n=1 Tax=Colletotrichum orchidophilum TaxID=1209926 RepID=A0A1G4AX37_9PEZI|nr:RNB domain-containing protein [Colletotrichum orchidophilum]OHE93653.1 RNB domain-containing protein [Colletotrichum orchidophilum]
MLRNSGRPYVCWRCLTSRTSRSPVTSGLTFAPSVQLLGIGSPAESRRPYTGGRSSYGGNHGGNYGHQGGSGRGGNYGRGRGGPRKPINIATEQEMKLIREKSDIRSRLRGWEATHYEPSRRLLQDLPMQDTPLLNYLTRPDLLPASMESMGAQDSELHENAKKNRGLFEDDELQDLRGSTSALKPGDLVETRYSSGRLPILAICVGRHHNVQYFYMSTGELVPERNIATLFLLKNFIEPSRLKPLVDILPEEPDTERRNALFHNHTPAALKTAARLQGELIKFYQESVSFYQTQLTLDTASSFLAKDEPQYLSLEELADKLLPDYVRVDDKFLPHQLYAVHTALNRDGWGFRPLNMKWHRRNYIYEVRSASDLKLLRKVENQVRELVEGAALRENPAQSLSLLRQNSLGSFILKARGVIQASRLRREWTPHGMIGPSNDKVENLATWSKQDIDYIRFIELWACHRIIPKPSQLESLGSTILKLTDCYNESDWVAHWTGFSFLQEIGWIPPWDIPARYEYKLAGATVQRGANMETPLVDVNASLRPDIAQGHRRDWGQTTIFCVDSEQTADVDDGFSVEAAEKPGEHWIHVHIADPASRIDPKSALARQLEKAPSSLYMSGYHKKMLPRDLEQQFSLNPGQPTLTFSAKVNEQGDILDHKVEPGTVQNVVHVPKNEVSAVLPGLEPAPSSETFAVGQPPQPPRPVKHITAAADLSQEDRDDLLRLNRLCKAIKRRRVEKGQLPPFENRFGSPEVSLDHIVVQGNAEDPGTSMAWQGDPFIRFNTPTRSKADRLVETLMHTAGEVAAKWCQARAVPVPYSTQPDAVVNARGLAAYRREHIDPLVAQGKPIPAEHIHRLLIYVGNSELSASPAPFYAVGVDAYAKATSPLRRFGDLVVHWQIHAALARERETGRSLVGETSSSSSDDAAFLPWTHRSLSHALPMLQALQRQIKQVDDKHGPTQWVAQALLRAWRFGEAPLPKTFRFIVDGVYSFGLRGRLTNFYNLGASVNLVRLGSFARLADVQVDDVMEVEIADINVVTMQIWCQPLGRRRPEGKDDAPVGDVADAVAQGGEIPTPA